MSCPLIGTTVERTTFCECSQEGTSGHSHTVSHNQCTALQIMVAKSAVMLTFDVLASACKPEGKQTRLRRCDGILHTPKGARLKKGWKR
jgi:hypothetical protein